MISIIRNLKKEKKMELIVENDCQRLEGKGNRERILKVTNFIYKKLIRSEDLNLSFLI